MDVVEPMEDLFSAMLQTRTVHLSKFFKMVGVLSLLAFARAEYGSHYIDRQYFDNTKKNIVHLIETEKHTDALKIIDNYHPPFISIIMPEFIRVRSEHKLPPLPIREVAASYFNEDCATVRRFRSFPLCDDTYYFH